MVTYISQPCQFSHVCYCQKQSPRDVLLKRCSQKFRKIQRKTPVPERLWHRCFPVNFAKFLRKPFFTEHLQRLFLYCKVNLPLRRSYLHVFYRIDVPENVANSWENTWNGVLFQASYRFLSSTKNFLLESKSMYVNSEQDWLIGCKSLCLQFKKTLQNS